LCALPTMCWRAAGAAQRRGAAGGRRPGGAARWPFCRWGDNASLCGSASNQHAHLYLQFGSIMHAKPPHAACTLLPVADGFAFPRGIFTPCSIPCSLFLPSSCYHCCRTWACWAARTCLWLTGSPLRPLRWTEPSAQVRLLFVELLAGSPSFAETT